MSVCLTATKSIALVSAGLNSGLCFGGVLSPEPTDVTAKRTTNNFDLNREIAIGVLSSLSTGFYAASYFGAPTQWKHPYLLYTGALALISTGITAFKLIRRTVWPIVYKRIRCHSKESHVDEKSSAHINQDITDSVQEQDNDESDHGQDDSVVLVSESSNHSIDSGANDAPSTLPLLPTHTENKSSRLSTTDQCGCSSLLSAFTSDAVLDTVRTISSVGLLLLGTVGGLGEPLALI